MMSNAIISIKVIIVAGQRFSQTVLIEVPYRL